MSSFQIPRHARTDRGSGDHCGTGGKQRLLLVAYHFGAGCATGGIRWNAMTAGLASRGWEFDVLTLARPTTHQETATADQTGPVLVHPVVRPDWPDRALALAAGAKRRFLRGRSSEAPVPGRPLVVRTWGAQDRRSAYTRLMANVSAARELAGDFAWGSQALHTARQIAAAHHYAAVIVSSPPHLAHRIGVALARDLRIPFVADFRDPWTFGVPDGYVSSGLDRWIGPVFESDVFSEASLVVCNTDWSRRAAERAAAGRRLRIATVPNGYDRLRQVAAPDAERFRVVFSGWLYPHMDPRPLLAACGRFRKLHARAAEALSVEFMGPAPSFGSVPLSVLAMESGLAGSFTLHPSAGREQALEFQQSAAVTTAFDYPYPLAVPMKFYDQAQMRGSMLLIGNTRGALADAAARIGIRVYAPADADGIDSALAAAFERWQRRDFAAPLDARGVFDREHTVELMHQALTQLVRAEQPPGSARTRGEQHLDD